MLWSDHSNLGTCFQAPKIEQDIEEMEQGLHENHVKENPTSPKLSYVNLYNFSS
jgi:hypothetical protein